MIVGFTGTQQGMTKQQKRLFLLLVHILSPSAFHHGDCIGADTQAHRRVLLDSMQSIKIEIHPPINPSKRSFCQFYDVLHEPKEYIDRNHDIVNACDILIATPKSHEEELRSGTWATIRYARKRGKQIYILWP